MAAPIKEKHLDLLQGVINRLAGNSFLLKAWSVTLAVAMLAVSIKVAVACLDSHAVCLTGVLSSLHSGLSETTSTGSQLRVLPLQRAGFAARAA